MNNFPFVSHQSCLLCYEAIINLYTGDKNKIPEAAVRATATEPAPITNSLDPVDTKILLIKQRLRRADDKYGQTLLFKLIEELFDDLLISGAINVSNVGFAEVAKIALTDESVISYNNNKKWYLTWQLEVDENKRDIIVALRDKTLATGSIVPDYILQYIQQGINAFRTNKFAASLALMTIALEGTLRDALAHKGYTYVFGAPTSDVYELKEMLVHKEAGGYKVTFPDPMPLGPAAYLSNPGDPLHQTFRIKRVQKGANTLLEIRNAGDLLDYWSSSTIVAPAMMNISGLGTALDISRNQAAILSNIDLPPDLDNVIQTVRNNLIHLSGGAMNAQVTTDSMGSPVTLESFIKSKTKVFDAVCTIGDAVNTIYEKISNGTL